MKKERNLGIDLLRIFSMHMIVLHHVLDMCGVSGGVKLFSMNYTVVCLLHSINHCGVNVYALISGYVYVDSNYKISNIIKIWLQVLFYTVGILIIFALLKPEMVNREILFTSLFPVLTERYWYFTQYVCMFFFIPILNIVLNTWSSRQFKRFFLVVIVLFCCVNMITYEDPFHIENGFSAVWLSVLYLIGGYIKKNPENVQWDKKKYLLIYITCILLTAASRWVIQIVTLKMFGVANNGGRFMLNTSPTILFSAIALLIIFSEMKVKKIQKWIRFLSPLTFGVYIIHFNVFLEEGYSILNGFVKPFLTANPVILIGLVLLIAEGIYLVSSFVDFGRIKLFQFLRVGVFCEWIDEKLSGFINRVI